MNITLEQRLNWLISQYPTANKDALRKMCEHKCRPLSKEQREKALSLWGLGIARRDVYRILGCSNSTLTYTMAAFSDFKEKWDAIQRERPLQVQGIMVKTLLDGAITKKITRVPTLDANGLPIIKNGKQVMHKAKEELIRTPASAALMMFYLKAHMPELYGNNATSAESDMMPLEELKKAIEEEKPKLFQLAG